MSTDLVQVRVRHDATGYIAVDAGRVISEPMPRDEAEHLVRAMPNGPQMELIPAPQHAPHPSPSIQMIRASMFARRALIEMLAQHDDTKESQR